MKQNSLPESGFHSTNTPLASRQEGDTPLLPVRRLHNFCYCPRLCYFQWVENIFIDNADTTLGSAIHKRVDVASPIKIDEVLQLKGKLIRSLELSSETLRLAGVLDLIEIDDQGGCHIIDYKKGYPRRNEEGEYLAKHEDAIQLAAYAMMLQEQGYLVQSARIYYAAAKTQVPVPLNEELRMHCQSAIKQCFEMAHSGLCPPPLKGSTRCEFCSLYPICLPNESDAWRLDEKLDNMRPPMPEHDEGEILVVQNREAYISLRSGTIRVSLKGVEQSCHPLEQLQAVYLYGAIQISAQAMQALISKGCQVSHFSAAGRFIGLSQGLPSSGVDARMGQYKMWEDLPRRVNIAKELILCKIHNQRVNLMRNGDVLDCHIKELAHLRDLCKHQTDLDSLRGLEGRAAAIYFAHFSSMLKTKIPEFDIHFRNRRPPKDPVNAMLSLAYSILSKELTGIAYSTGLDPFLGFFHSPRYGRPALALDMMEEFRPLIADSVVITLINRGEVGAQDFDYTSRGVMLKDDARRQFWRAWARRMDTAVTHPSFGYRMSYRRMMIVQMRQFWRFCRGDITQFKGFTTR